MEFYYFSDKRYPIKVTHETTVITKYTFPPNGEMWEGPSLAQFFKQIDTTKKVNIVDIGAQSGLYTLYSKYLPNAHFYSFEPFPDTYKLLNDNLTLNNIPADRVTTFQMALSDKCEKTFLYVCNNHNGLHTMGENPLRFSKDNTILLEITSSTLDEQFYNKDIPVDYIKIDTEGWEYKILLGGLKTIKKYNPIIQLEWNTTNMKQCNVKENDLKDLLHNLGYIEKSMVEEEKLFIPNV